jgi:hypothetical protein
VADFSNLAGHVQDVDPSHQPKRPTLNIFTPPFLKIFWLLNILDSLMTNLHPTSITDFTCVDFGESTDMSLHNVDLGVGFEHQAVHDDHAQMAPQPSLYLETDSHLPNPYSSQHREQAPGDSWESLLWDDSDVNSCPCARIDKSLKGFIVHEVLEE